MTDGLHLGCGFMPSRPGGTLKLDVAQTLDYDYERSGRIHLGLVSLCNYWRWKMPHALLIVVRRRRHGGQALCGRDVTQQGRAALPSWRRQQKRAGCCIGLDDSNLEQKNRKKWKPL